MNRSTILRVALGLVALTGFGSAGVAVAQGIHSERRDQSGDWQRGDEGDWDRRDNDRDYDRRGNDRDWNGRGNSGVRDFTGMWRLDERRNRQGRNGDWGSVLRNRLTQLPSVIRIERARRELRVENSNGRLLREIDLRGGDVRDGRVQVVSSGFGGTRVVETFTLRDRGRELVVHTTVHGRRGTQQFTSIYDRA